MTTRGSTGVDERRALVAFLGALSGQLQEGINPF